MSKTPGQEGVTAEDLNIARAIVEVAEKARFDETMYLTVMDLEKGIAEALSRFTEFKDKQK